MNHTQEKLFVSSDFLIVTKGAKVVADIQPLGIPELDIPYEEAIANAHELVRRWNAFEEDGAATKMLGICEQFVKGYERGASMPLSWLIKETKKIIAIAENERNPE